MFQQESNPEPLDCESGTLLTVPLRRLILYATFILLELEKELKKLIHYSLA